MSKDTTSRLEYGRDQQGRLVAAAERTRIARAVQGIITHSLPVRWHWPTWLA